MQPENLNLASWYSTFHHELSMINFRNQQLRSMFSGLSVGRKWAMVDSSCLVKSYGDQILWRIHGLDIDVPMGGKIQDSSFFFYCGPRVALTAWT